MKSIRKIQNDCQLLYMLETNTDVLDKTYNAYIFDKKEHKRDIFQYSVYVPELKLVSKLKSSCEYQQYHKDTVKIYLFSNENNMKRKIRIEVV